MAAVWLLLTPATTMTASSAHLLLDEHVKLKSQVVPKFGLKTSNEKKKSRLFYHTLVFCCARDKDTQTPEYLTGTNNIRLSGVGGGCGTTPV
jgi:hypothetical protein